MDDIMYYLILYYAWPVRLVGLVVVVSQIKRQEEMMELVKAIVTIEE